VLVELSLALLVTACAQPALALTDGVTATLLATAPAIVTRLGQIPTQSGASSSSAALRHNPPAACQVTTAPAVAFTPPAPYPAQPPARYVGEFWYGSAALWTMLSQGGTWSGLPHDQAGYSQKVFWWREGYQSSVEQKPELTVTGRRLDGDAAPLVGSGATNASADFGDAMLVGVEVPTLGCWEITGHYHGHDLSFVIWVAP